MRITYFILLVCVLIAVLQLVLQFPSLPERVATHFGAGGEPNAFSSKSVFVLMMLAFVIGMPVFLVVLAKIMRYLPKSMINIPNREYYLHPDRAEKTLAEMETSMIWLATITEIFLIGLVQLTISANTQGKALSMTGFSILMIFYMCAITAFCVLLIRRYGRPQVGDH